MRDGRVLRWMMYRSLEPEVKEEEDTTAPVSEEAIEVTVSEIVDGTHCFLHYTKDDGLANIEAKMKAFAQVNRTDTHTHVLLVLLTCGRRSASEAVVLSALWQDAAAAKLTFEPRKGSVVAALFDDTW